MFEYDDNKYTNEENKEDFMEDDQDSLRVNFLCIIFVLDAIITGGEDGCVYIFYLIFVRI